VSDSAVISPQLPEDCTLASITSAAAALGTTERSAREILAEAGIPIVELGQRTRGIRVSDLRSLLKRRERAA
jgi:hypothetical protein